MRYFIHRHSRQAAGLEGLNLEAQARNKVQDHAKSIGRSDVREPVDSLGSSFTVMSQSDPMKQYSIHIGSRATCSCPSFPRLLYCKHICAVQRHFPEVGAHLKTVLLSDSLRSPQNLPSESSQVSSREVTSQLTSAAAADLALAHQVAAQLQNVIAELKSNPEAQSSESLRLLSQQVSKFSSETSSSVLPQSKVKIAPNQRSEWKKTAAAMGSSTRKPKVVGLAIKTGAKRKFTRSEDPYAGGERSGKKAKADAREAPVLYVLFFRTYSYL